MATFDGRPPPCVICGQPTVRWPAGGGWRDTCSAECLRAAHVSDGHNMFAEYRVRPRRCRGCGTELPSARRDAGRMLCGDCARSQRRRQRVWQTTWRPAYRARPEVREREAAAAAEYRARPEVKTHAAARQLAYYARPDVARRRAAYGQRPEVKARRRAYDQRPEEIARRAAYGARPEVQERVLRRQRTRTAARRLDLLRQLARLPVDDDRVPTLCTRLEKSLAVERRWAARRADRQAAA